MDMTCYDPAFGEMTYHHRWYKKQTIHMLGKEWNITVAAKAYSGKPITEEERKSYCYFLENEQEMVHIMHEKLVEYVNTYLHSPESSWSSITSQEDLSSPMVMPKTLLFKQDGTTLMLFDFLLDKDGGIAVQLTPENAVGIQDCFL